jgi:hypothetical protein
MAGGSWWRLPLLRYSHCYTVTPTREGALDRRLGVYRYSHSGTGWRVGALDRRLGSVTPSSSVRRALGENVLQLPQFFVTGPHNN